MKTNYAVLEIDYYGQAETRPTIVAVQNNLYRRRKSAEQRSALPSYRCHPVISTQIHSIEVRRWLLSRAAVPIEAVQPVPFRANTLQEQVKVLSVFCVLMRMPRRASLRCGGERLDDAPLRLRVANPRESPGSRSVPTTPGFSKARALQSHPPGQETRM